jgi:hypothetical protein
VDEKSPVASRGSETSVKSLSHAAGGNLILFASRGDKVLENQNAMVGRNIFHLKFVSASGDLFAALSRNEAKCDSA